MQANLFRKPSARRYVGAVIAVISALSVAACGGNTTASPTNDSGMATIRLNWTTTDYAPVLLGVDTGIFEKHGVKVEVAEAAVADLAGALISGKADMGVNTGPGLVLAAGKGLPLVAVAGVTTFARGQDGTTGSALLVKKGSSIQAPRDLEGKTVAVNILASASEYAIRKEIQKGGGDHTKTSIVEVPFASMPDALLAGNVDAALAADPALTSALESGNFETPFGDPVESTFGPSPRIIVTATKEYTVANAKTVEKFRAGLAEAIEFSSKNPDALHPIYEKYFRMTPEQARKITLNQYNVDLGSGSFKVASDILTEFGAVKKPIDSDALVAP